MQVGQFELRAWFSLSWLFFRYKCLKMSCLYGIDSTKPWSSCKLCCRSWCFHYCHICKGSQKANVNRAIWISRDEKSAKSLGTNSPTRLFEKMILPNKAFKALSFIKGAPIQETLCVSCHFWKVGLSWRQCLLKDITEWILSVDGPPLEVNKTCWS